MLLLHGFPQTSLGWEQVAAQLVTEHCIVMPDLRGCGESRARAGGDHRQGHSKREMANELVELMITFGSNRFAVVGGRGVAFSAWRLARPISKDPSAR